MESEPQPAQISISVMEWLDLCLKRVLRSLLRAAVRIEVVVSALA